jgi:hypothetical protein
MFTFNGTGGDALLATISDRNQPTGNGLDAKTPETAPVKIMSTGDFDEMLLELEDADEIFTDEMIFNFRTGRAFSLGC